MPTKQRFDMRLTAGKATDIVQLFHSEKNNQDFDQILWKFAKLIENYANHLVDIFPWQYTYYKIVIIIVGF